MKNVKVRKIPTAIGARAELENEFFPNATEEQIKFLDRAEKLLAEQFSFGHSMGRMFGEGWSNNACLGYAIMAAKAINLTEEQIQQLINSMRYKFDMKSIEEAKEIYQTSIY